MREETLAQKIEEVINELKRNRLWKKNPPDWVQLFSARPRPEENDFASWLQFVYLPNLQQHAHYAGRLHQCFVTPQVVKCLPSCAANSHLLTLFIELDSLT